MLESKTKVYYAIRDALRRPDVRYVNSEGGTRSSKTFSALQVLIEIAKGCRGMDLYPTMPPLSCLASHQLLVSRKDSYW